MTNITTEQAIIAGAGFISLAILIATGYWFVGLIVFFIAMWTTGYSKNK